MYLARTSHSALRLPNNFALLPKRCSLPNPAVKRQVHQAATNATPIPSTVEVMSIAADGTQEFTYVTPPAFMHPHEVIPGGHIPDSLLHINMIENALEWLHNNAHLPWWGVIATATIAFRICLLPLNISLVRNSERLKSIAPQLQKLGDVLRDKTLADDDPKKFEAARQMDKLFKVNNCAPYKNLATPIVMFPMFISVFLAVERICLHDPLARTEGLLWFHDLSLIDPTTILPVISALTWLATIEMGAAEPRDKVHNEIRRLWVPLTTVAFIPVTAALPAGVFVYWITSNLFSMVQIQLLKRSKRLRSLLGIPDNSHLPPVVKSEKQE